MRFQAYTLRPVSVLILFLTANAGYGQEKVEVINMIPNWLSDEIQRDSEPSVAVNPANPLRIAASAFTPDPGNSGSGPIFISTNGGDTWDLNVVLPGGNKTGDTSIRFGGRSDVLYGGILRSDAFLRMNILRKADFTAAGLMDVLVTRDSEDQPWVEATTVLSGIGSPADRVFVGNNNFGVATSPRRTASVDPSQSAAVAPAPAGFSTRVIEARSTGTANQDGPPIRTAHHSDGTVYAVFFAWTAASGSTKTSDIVVVRDDAWGSGGTPFTALTDGDGFAGKRVVTGVTVVFNQMLGNQRTGGQAAIAVDPRDSSTVYIAWCDGTPTYTLHLRRSTNRGVTWSADLRTISGATNPALAVNTAGKAGFLYQQLVNPGSGNRWQTHLERSADGFASSPVDITLANVPDSLGSYAGSNPIGDYANLVAVGKNFYGVFSAFNTADEANFPSGVVYQRNSNFTTHQLLGTDGTTVVADSIDPFFFRVRTGPQIQVPGALDLGDACTGSKKVGTLNVCNTGEEEDLIVSGIASSNPQFSVTAPSSGFPVTISHDFCFPFQVVFDATAAGPQSATLTIASNALGNPNTEIQVSAAGTEADIRVTGSTDFGMASAWTPAEKTVSVCNTGGCNLEVSAASVTCADFTLINNPFPAAVSHDSCLDLVMRFTPQRPGHKTCQLNVASNDPDTPMVSRTLTARTPPSFSLHVGLAEPHGALSSVAKQGSTFNLDFVYPFAPKWAWDVRLGRSSFDGKAGLPDTDVDTLSANAKYTFNPAAAVRVFLNGGIGAYHFDPGNFEGGANLGIGLNVPLVPIFALELTYNYHSAFTAAPDLEFSQVQLGLLVSF